MQVEKQQLEPDMEQQTGSNLGKEYITAVYCHPAYLTYMQSISGEIPGWMKHKLESRLPGEIPITSGNANDTILTAESKEELKSLLMKVKEESEKAESKELKSLSMKVKKESEKVGLKLNFQREESRWRRTRTGRPLSLLQIHRKKN